MFNQLKDRLLKKGFEIAYNPRGDGNCFFAAVAYQMAQQDGHKLKELSFAWLQNNRFDVSITTIIVMPGCILSHFEALNSPRRSSFNLKGKLYPGLPHVSSIK